jgi:hypothetical protein
MATAITRALPQLAADINTAHEAAIHHANQAIEHALTCGRLLIQAKEQLPHGGFLPWLQDHCRVKARQAQQYMRLADNWQAIEAKSAPGAHLSIKGALGLLAGPKVDTTTPESVLDDVPPEERKRLSNGWLWVAKHALLLDAAGWNAPTIAEYLQADIETVDLILAPMPVSRADEQFTDLFKRDHGRSIAQEYDACVRGFIHTVLALCCAEARTIATTRDLHHVADVLAMKESEHKRRRERSPVFVQIKNQFHFTVIANCIMTDAKAALGHRSEDWRIWRGSFAFMVGDIANGLHGILCEVIADGTDPRVDHAKLLKQLADRAA